MADAETSKELEKIIPKGVKSEKSSTMRKVTLELQKPPEIRIQEPSKGILRARVSFHVLTYTGSCTLMHLHAI